MKYDNYEYAIAEYKPLIINRFKEMNINTLEFLRKRWEHRNWKGIYNDIDVKIFNSIRNFTTFNRTKDSTTVIINFEKLEVEAIKYADYTIAEWIVKIKSKVGLLESATIENMNNCTFKISGNKNDSKVEIIQDMIINYSKYNKPFNQFPARIYINNKAISEAKFKKI